MTSLRQVSWLAGRRLSPPSQALLRKAQWRPGEGLAADSCGSSSGLGPPSKRRNAPDSLLADQIWVGAPELRKFKDRTLPVSSRSIYFAQVCGDPATHGRVAHSPGDAACGSEIDGEEAIRTDRETPALGQMIRGEQATAQLQG